MKIDFNYKAFVSDELLTVRELAGIMNVSKKTVYNYISTNKITMKSYRNLLKYKPDANIYTKGDWK